MKKYILMTMLTIMSMACYAQSVVLTQTGKCGTDVSWDFDGKTLYIRNVSKFGLPVSIKDYDMRNNIAPWVKKKLPVRSVHIGIGISRIGSCAFANCQQLTDVVFEGTSLKEIGWAAFYGCNRLRNISLPTQLRKIETIAFANCASITAITIPDQCRVEDQAFVNCMSIKSLGVSPTATIGQYAFAHEVNVDGHVRHALYDGEIRRMPAYVNISNCNTFGVSKKAMGIYLSNNSDENSKDKNYDYATAELDTVIPNGISTRNTTYALIIGNENYRFVPEVPYAIHDARVFTKYCEKTLGIPAENVHLCEDATKQMIQEEELDWLKNIPEREYKKLIVYYAGHGVPDTKNKNKAYLLPTDVRGTRPSHGIALDEFYAQLDELGFNQTSVFLDACFSGINRNNEGVNENTRGVEITPEEATLGNGKLVVFSAAQGNETAQGYNEQGHGLFTYYLLKAMQENYGYVNYGQLADYLKTNVSRTATTFKTRKPQTPTVNATAEISDSWRNINL